MCKCMDGSLPQFLSLAHPSIFTLTTYVHARATQSLSVILSIMVSQRELAVCENALLVHSHHDAQSMHDATADSATQSLIQSL